MNNVKLNYLGRSHGKKLMWIKTGFYILYLSYGPRLCTVHFDIYETDFAQEMVSSSIGSLNLRQPSECSGLGYGHALLTT